MYPNIDPVTGTSNPYGVILGKALYENLISVEEAKKIA